MIDRREFLGISLGAGAALALTPELLRALRQSSANLIQRAIPSSGEMLPVIGLGRGSIAPSLDRVALKDVVRMLVDNGGRVVDTVHGGAAAEQAMGTIANELGIQNRIFWSTPLPRTAPPAPPGPAGPPPKADAAAVKAQIEASFGRLQVPRIDLVMVLAIGNVDISTQLAVLREMKKEGRVRYIGVTDLLPPPSVKGPVGANLEAIMRNEPIDFVGFDYSVGDRRAEQTLLPLAQERKIGVLAYFPFDRARIFQRASATPLPEWAAEFDAKTWAQFFLKYVVSHPAVTVVRTGTSNPAHMLDNIGGGIGRLPNEAMRERMAEFVEALPATPPAAPPTAQQQASQAPPVVLSAVILDRYVGEYRTAAGMIVTFRRDGATLFVKPGTNPEVPLVARSETRFSDPRGPVLEFQLDDAGTVTGLVIEQASQKIPASRIR